MRKPDCVLSYHMEPALCGVAKFNFELARRLNVPFSCFAGPSAYTAKSPLLSVKLSEFVHSDAGILRRYLDNKPHTQELQVFLHDFSYHKLEMKLLDRAEIVYAANAEIAENIRGLAPKIVEAWAPSMILDKTRFRQTEISVFTFGMAHKIQARHYAKLDRLLEGTGKSYCLRVSCALHEGIDLSTAFDNAIKSIKEVFSGPIYFLGFLSDAAVYNELLTCNYFAAFFPKGLRANNTSVQAAIEAGATVITNTDDFSPYNGLVIDVTECQRLPEGMPKFEGDSWDDLVHLMEGNHETDNSSQYADRPCDVAVD